jgi:antagonist of KipI
MVRRAGLCTLVVDHGRPCTRSLGVPVGGAADQFALALGNALVGNPPDAAALEVTLAGPTLIADADLACVLFGAPFDLTRGGQPIEADRTFTLAAGEEVHIGGTAHAMRAYFCVRGGLPTPMVLGSRSGFAPLAAGSTLPCSSGHIGGRRIHLPQREISLQDPVSLHVLEGAQATWFNAGEIYGPRFRVSPSSDRMGLRLRGAPLTMSGRELVSEPVCPGAVQVTSDGQCIILGVDGQTIGGYPKVAQVIAADLDLLAQLRPGQEVTFVPVELQEAESRYRERQAVLSAWVLRLQASDTL